MFLPRRILEEKLCGFLGEDIGQGDITTSLTIPKKVGENEKLFGYYSQIRYQKNDRDETWHKFHICFNTYQYEYCLDMRKLYKMSISFILAYAIENYLNELCDLLTCCKDKKYTDNYLYKNYILTNNTIDGVICWQLYWGFPQKLNSILKLT